MAGRFRPQLMLMDIHLGSQMDGVTAAKTIRTQSDIPCIFLSAFTGTESLARAKLVKPIGYLAKPFTGYELRTFVAEVLAKI